MALRTDNDEKIDKVLSQHPGVYISLRPIAPPAALALAGFSGSTFITAAYLAGWYGNSESPLIFFPFVAFWGGLAQFIAGIMGFQARDVLVTVINTMWGAFWMSIGLLYAFVAAGALPPHAVDEHFPELASWFVVLTAFTWSGVSFNPSLVISFFSLCGVHATRNVVELNRVELTNDLVFNLGSRSNSSRRHTRCLTFQSCDWEHNRLLPVRIRSGRRDWYQSGFVLLVVSLAACVVEDNGVSD